MKTKIFILIITLIQILFIVKTKNISKIIANNNDSEITLLLRGSGNQFVLKDGFYPLPNEVYINGTLANFIGGRPKINLQGELNIITLKWNKKITNCEEMFRSRTNIIEIDLSKFDSSLVSDMR